MNRTLFFSMLLPLCILVWCDNAVADQYSIVDDFSTPVPWQNRITASKLNCSDEQLGMINSSGGVWRIGNQTNEWEFEEQQLPHHQHAVFDTVSNQLYFYRNDSIFHSDGQNIITDFVTDLNDVSWMYSWDGEFVLCSESKLTLISKTSGTISIDIIDSLGVVPIEGTIYYANTNGMVCRVNVKSHTIMQHPSLFNEMLVGTMEGLLVVYKDGVIRLTNGTMYLDSITGVPSYSNYICGSIGGKLLLVGSNNTIVNQVLSLDFDTDEVVYLGDMTAQSVQIVANRECDRLWAIGYPVTVTEFTTTNGIITRGFTASNKVSYVHYVDYSSPNELVCVAEASEPELRSGVDDVFVKVIINTESKTARTICSVIKMNDEYVQSHYMNGDGEIYLTTNKRILKLGDSISTLVESDDIITASACNADTLIYSTTKGLFRKTNSEHVLVQGVKVDSFVVVVMESVNDTILITESRVNLEPSKRFSIYRDGLVETLDVVEPSQYNRFYMNGNRIVFMGRKLVGQSIEENLAFGSVVNHSFIQTTSDTVNSAIFVQHQNGDALFGYVYPWNVIQISLDGRKRIWQKPDGVSYINQFSAISNIHNSKAWVVVNSTLPSQLLSLDLSTTETIEHGLSYDYTIQTSTLKRDTDGWSLWVGDNRVAADFILYDCAGRSIVAYDNIVTLGFGLIPTNQFILICASHGSYQAIEASLSIE